MCVYVKIKPYLQLARPANIVTSVADVVAGYAMVSASENPVPDANLFLLMASTIGLYGGGVVFNDVFDADVDAIERPERPIPRGLVSIAQASVFGGVLLSFGIASAFFSGVYSGSIATMIAVFALVYDRYGKHHAWIGPLNMGICRGLNLLLGMSYMPIDMLSIGYLALVPVVYIAAVTLISRGEVHAGGVKNLYIGSVLMLSVLVLQMLVFGLNTPQFRTQHLIYHLIFFSFVLSGLYYVYKAMANAIKSQGAPQEVMTFVKTAVISIIVVDALWAIAFGHFMYAAAICMMLPISKYFAKTFSVT